MGREQRFRRLHEISGNRAGRDEVQRLVEQFAETLQIRTLLLRIPPRSRHERQSLCPARQASVPVQRLRHQLRSYCRDCLPSEEEVFSAVRSSEHASSWDFVRPNTRLHATDVAVWFSAPLAHISAPFASSCLIARLLPLNAAVISAVSPTLLFELTLAPALMRNSTISPSEQVCEADIRGVVPSWSTAFITAPRPTRNFATLTSHSQAASISGESLAPPVKFGSAPASTNSSANPENRLVIAAIKGVAP